MNTMKWWNIDGGQMDEGSTYSGEKFRGLRYFIREDIQNSIDAKLDNQDPVRVVVDLHKVNTKDLPDEDGLRTIFHERLESQIEEAAKGKLADVKRSFQKETVWILRFSDFNTKGLKYEAGNRNSSWHTLVLAVNRTTKSGNEGGSFGLGKSVNLANSSRKQVFYRSLSAVDGSFAFQGLAFFASSPRNANDGKMHYNSAYVRYGVDDETPSIVNQSFLSFADRDEAGTDIFIVDPVGINNNFADELGNLNELSCDLLWNVIANFAVSLKQGILSFELQQNGKTLCTLSSSDDVLAFINNQVFVANQDVQKQNLTEIAFFKKYFSDQVQTASVIVDNVAVATLFYTLEDELGNYMYGCREPGMQIKPWSQRIRPETRYQFVLQVTDSHAAKLLRELESPEHTEWDPQDSGRGSQDAIAFQQNLRKQVSFLLKESARKFNEEKIAVRNIDVLKSNGDTDDEITDLKLKPLRITIPEPSITKQVKPKKSRARVKRTLSTKFQDIDIEGIGGNAGDQNGIHIGQNKGTQIPSGTAGYIGDVEGQTQGVVLEPDADKKKPVLMIVNAEFLSVSPELGKYYLRFVPPKKATQIRIVLSYVGEQEDGSIACENVISVKNADAIIKNGNLEITPKVNGKVSVMFQTVEKDFATLVGDFYAI